MSQKSFANLDAAKRCTARRRAIVSAPLRFATLLLATTGVIPVFGAADERPEKAAVERARGCVLKVECVDRSGADVPTVLSAVVWDEDGYLITVGLRSPNDRRIRVNDSSGRKYEARWVATDDYSGLSVLKLEAGVAHPPELSGSIPDVGSSVLVVGNPFGLSHSVSVGVVSGLDRTVSSSGGIGRGMIQFTAPVFPGDGGGLLADYDGRMLGVISTSLNDPMSGEWPERRIMGIGFAIPVTELRGIVQQLRAGQRVERGYLGLSAEDVEPAGVRIVSVFKDSPAQKAGLLAGDLIDTMDDHEVIDFDSLAGRVERLRPGTDIALRIRRGGDPISVHAMLVDRPASGVPRRAAPERFDLNPLALRIYRNLDSTRRSGVLSEIDAIALGAHTQPVTDTLAKSLGLANREGVLVSGVVPGTPAARSGLQVSDVIITLNGDAVRSPQQLQERIRKLEQGTQARLEVFRDGAPVTIDVKVVQPGLGSMNSDQLRLPGAVLWSAESQRSLEALEERVKSLEAELSELRKLRDSKRP